MERRKIGCRIMMALLAAAVAAAGLPAAAQSPGVIEGAVTSADGLAIPEGVVEIYVEDSAVPDRAQRRAADLTIASDGKRVAIPFSLPPADAMGLSTVQVVARLERPDGWLIARGHARLQPDAPVWVILDTVMY